MCSVPITVANGGSYGPLTGADGTQVNAVAWKEAVGTCPAVLSLGPSATAPRNDRARCADIRDSAIPIGTGPASWPASPTDGRIRSIPPP